MKSLLIVAAVVLAAEVRADVDVETLAGRRVSGALVELSGDGVAVRAAEGETKLAAADIARVTFPVKASSEPAKPAAWMQLVDGTELVASELSRTKGKFA